MSGVSLVTPTQEEVKRALEATGLYVEVVASTTGGGVFRIHSDAKGEVFLVCDPQGVLRRASGDDS